MCVCSSVYKIECFVPTREKTQKLVEKVAIILSMLRTLKMLLIMQTERSLSLTGEGDVWGWKVQ